MKLLIALTLVLWALAPASLYAAQGQQCQTYTYGSKGQYSKTTCTQTGTSAADEEAAEDRKLRREMLKAWEACERKKDWPNHPSNCDHLLPRD